MKAYLGVDVGSVSTNVVVMDEHGQVQQKIYLRTQGQPINAIKKSLLMVDETFPQLQVLGVGTTGSARHLAAVIVGADCVKNEITAHAVAASATLPEVRTIVEIGGQDSKLILLKNGIVTDFAMNTVCAAGTGSFLDQQAARLGLPIEEFALMATKSRAPVRIAGRCAVFAESDMIHKQQMGYSLADIVAGLCEALVRNFLNNLGKAKELKGPIVFQGGVAANAGMREAFQRALDSEIIVPEHFNVMGALGMAIMAHEHVRRSGYTKFKGISVAQGNYTTGNDECTSCPNRCEVVSIQNGGETLARWGDRCGRWSTVKSAQADIV